MYRLVTAALYVGLLSTAAADIVPPSPNTSFAYVVLFEADSTAITPAAQLVLSQVLADYRAFKPTVVHVNGYYDRSLTQGEADRISKRMAEAVRDYIVSTGVPSDVVVLGWYGEDPPIVQTKDGVAESANRSVDILFDDGKNRARP